MQRLILIDSHAIIHRAYHALPPLTTPSGEPVQAVYGFVNILLKALRELKPDYIAAAFDMPGPTFRHIAYEKYKAQRPETPSDLASQFSKVKEVLNVFGIPIFEKQGYEADDVIGTIAAKLEKNKDVETIILTGDLDALQLVRPRLKVYSMKKGVSDTVVYDTSAVKERYDLKPEALVDFKGLKGDPSDNIPGIKGIGEKTATQLLKDFGSLEKIYRALERGTKKISSSVAKVLFEGKEDAFFSQELARIRCDVPIEFEIGEAHWSGEFGSEAIRGLFYKFGFTSLLKRLGSPEQQPVSGQQVSLLEGAQQLAPINTVDSSERFIRALLGRIDGKDIGLGLFNQAVFVVLRGASEVLQLDINKVPTRDLKNFFENQEFFVHDGKSVIRFLRERGVGLGKIKFDTMLAAYLVGSFSRDFSYGAILRRELAVSPLMDDASEFSHFFEVVDSLQSKLKEGRIGFVFENIELPLIPVLAEMERRGVLLDVEFLGRFALKIDSHLSRLANSIYDLAGEVFNISSTQQLSRILFDKLKIESRGLRKTEKGGAISTRESELEKLKDKHPVVSKILEYRELTKLKNTYIDVLPTLVDKKDGRIHTTFNQTGTATGRLSSASPNLQNIPIISEYGREIRKAFVAPPGFLLVSFDYSQIELRAAAHIAQDEKMIEAFKKGLDIHAMTAAEINNIPLDQVTSELRRAAKTLNFGILYGMGPQVLAESTGMTQDEAKKFIQEYFHDFSGIKNYIEETKKFVEENGYVETIFGRRRYIPEAHSPNWQLKREAERMAINMPIQGTATGDIVKLAMIKIDEWIKKEKLGNEVRMLLQVHDELLFEIKKDLVEKVGPKIKGLMEGAAKLEVPLVADVKAGANWGEQGVVKS